MGTSRQDRTPRRCGHGENAVRLSRASESRDSARDRDRTAEARDSGAVTSQAGAIGLALFATAMGLMTAIPLVFMHVLFKDGNHRFELKMKASAQKLITLVQNTRVADESAKPRG